jgi:hypothetical protein
MVSRIGAWINKKFSTTPAKPHEESNEVPEPSENHSDQHAGNGQM